MLIILAAFAWAGLSVLMVVWGWPGALVAVSAVAVGVVLARRLTRNTVQGDSDA